MDMPKQTERGVWIMDDTEVVRMKRLISLLLAMFLLFAAASFAETAEEGDEPEAVPMEGTDEGDDSNPVPVDMMEDEDLEVEEQVLQGRVLQYGDTGEDVLAVQTRLKELHYYTGNLSGRYREGTRKAVTEFQADFDLDQTGVADLRTLSILFSLNHRPLRFGSSGEDVKELQVKLTELGYYKGKISGNYLDSTMKAVKAGSWERTRKRTTRTPPRRTWRTTWWTRTRTGCRCRTNRFPLPKS